MNPRASNFLETQVSPWLRLVTPIALALILFILDSVNVSIDLLRQEFLNAREIVAQNRVGVSKNRTAIEIYHNHNGDSPNKL